MSKFNLLLIKGQVMKTQKHKFFNLTQLIDEDNVFKYYTMENEEDLVLPHIHICANLDNPRWRGKIFKNEQNLKTIASINLIKKGGNYASENIIFYEIYDDRIKMYKQHLCDWLNKVDELYVDSKITNADIALRSYKLSNNKCL